MLTEEKFHQLADYVAELERRSGYDFEELHLLIKKAHATNGKIANLQNTINFKIELWNEEREYYLERVKELNSELENQERVSQEYQSKVSELEIKNRKLKRAYSELSKKYKRLSDLVRRKIMNLSKD